MDNSYSLSIYWSADDAAFIALSPDFPGLSAFGGTPEDAAREATAALAAMLDSLREDGGDVPQPRLLPTHSGQLRIRIPKTLHTRLALEAERQGVSLNALIASFLERGQTQNDMLAAVRAELETAMRAVEQARADLAALDAAQKKAEEAFSFGASLGATLAYTSLETTVSYTPTRQPVPRVFLRS